MPLRAPSHLTLALSAACAAAAIAIAGCGGGDDPTTTSASAFVSQADAICADVTAQIGKLEPPTDEMQSIAEYTAGQLAILKPAVGKLQALTPPDDLKASYDTYLASVSSQIQVGEALNKAATEGDAKAVRAQGEKLSAEDTQKEAAALGFAECAKGA